MSTNKHITLLTSGTRGDVQPLVALGLGLQRAGYAVRVLTHEPFKALITAHGLEFTRLDGNPNELFLRPEFRSALIYDGRPLRSARMSLRYMQAARPLFQRMLNSAWERCQGTDALIITLPTTWGDQIAEALGIPCIWALTQPIGRTSMFPSPLQPFDLALGPIYNRLSHIALEQLVWQPWRAILIHWREAILGLPPLASIGWQARTAARGDLFLYGFSARVVPRPPDWPARAHVTGYWFLAPEPGWQPPASVLAFLEAGPPPLYVGFGGAGAEKDEALYAMLLRALARTGKRCIMSTNEQVIPRNWPAHVLPISSIPHSWLFPQLVAAVHHGGPGTSAEAIRAGIPSVCVPFGADQFFWSRRLAMLGCGPAPLPRRRMTVERLTDAISAALSTPAIRAAAAELGAQLRSEDGIERAVALIDARL